MLLAAVKALILSVRANPECQCACTAAEHCQYWQTNHVLIMEHSLQPAESHSSKSKVMTLCKMTQCKGLLSLLAHTIYKQKHGVPPTSPTLAQQKIVSIVGRSSFCLTTKKKGNSVNNDGTVHIISIVFICICEEWRPNIGVLKVDQLGFQWTSGPSSSMFLPCDFVCTRVIDEC